MSSLAERHGISAFELFCAYHLGITADGGYRFQNVHDVARRFGCSSAVIKQLLAELQMDPDSIIHSSYDMASAQVDVMCAPEGISRKELARQMFEDFLKAPRRARNWAKELAEDARENERVYGAGRGGRATPGSDAPRSPDRVTPDVSPADRGTRRGPRS
jgi:hypothetical protein